MVLPPSCLTATIGSMAANRGGQTRHAVPRRMNWNGCLAWMLNRRSHALLETGYGAGESSAPTLRKKDMSPVSERMTRSSGV